MAEPDPVLRIVALAALIMGALFALSGVEEFIRTDPASSNGAGLVFVLVAISLFVAARIARSAQNKDRKFPIFYSDNAVFNRLLTSREGQVGMAIFVSGMILSILASAVLRLNIYSLALFAGFPLIVVGIIWIVVMTFVSMVAMFREFRAELHRGQTD